MGVYPNRLKSFTPVNEPSDPSHWSVERLNSVSIQDIYDEISAIETELGLLPKGEYASVVARLNGLSNAPAIYVAASNASAASKAWAAATGGYVCDGTADEEQILAAINALPAVGGKVLLSEGTFYIASLITVASSKPGVTIEGQGWATELRLAANTTMFQIGDASALLYNFRMAHLMLEGLKATYTTATNDAIEVAKVQRAVFEHIRIKDFKGDGFSVGQEVSAYNYIFWILLNWIHGCGNDGMNISYAEGVRIIANSIQTPGRNGITFDGNCGYNDVLDNEIENVGEDGIYLNWVDVHRIFGNQISNVQEYGIDNNQSTILATANQIADCGRKTDNTYSHIRLNTNSANQGASLLNGNRMHKPNAGNDAKYCIENVTGDNIIVNNQVADAQTKQIQITAGNPIVRNNPGSDADGLILDPGDGNAIPVTLSGHVPLVTSGAETRTLADAAAPGITLDLYFKTDGGDCVITTASPVNQAGNNTLTFDTVGEHIRLTSIEDGADYEWRVVANDGVGLTTV